MKKVLGCVLLVGTLFAQEYKATLSGHLVIPSKTFIAPPKDAPEFLKTTGKIAQKTRNETLRSIPSQGNRKTDYYLPFEGQAIQGHSGIAYHDGKYFVLSDNGLGRKDNSVDSMLYINIYDLDFKKNSTKHISTIFFKDPKKVATFPITLEGSKERYLTGSDFDPESFQIIGEDIWVGEEFGPFLLRFGKDGVLKEVFDVPLKGKNVVSPNNPKIAMPESPDKREIDFNLGRSKGFEGMAKSLDGSKLYLMLEGGVYENGSYETKDGKIALNVIEFDVKAKKFTGKNYRYFLEDNAYAIGEFSMISEKEGLVIERDGAEGIVTKQCKGANTQNCFANPAKFKRIYKVVLDDSALELKKVAFIDLLKIDDPNKISKKPLVNGKFAFPFETIEGVDLVGKNHIVVVNDNNFPFSSSREPNKTDDNEFILLEVGDFLKAK